jgi:hypothetical protein
VNGFGPITDQQPRAISHAQDLQWQCTPLEDALLRIPMTYRYTDYRLIDISNMESMLLNPPLLRHCSPMRYRASEKRSW